MSDFVLRVFRFGFEEHMKVKFDKINKNNKHKEIVVKKEEDETLNGVIGDVNKKKEKIIKKQQVSRAIKVEEAIDVKKEKSHKKVKREKELIVKIEEDDEPRVEKKVKKEGTFFCYYE